MITKQESIQIKGIAILMMLFLHLFNTPERIALCTTSVDFWNGKPLVYAMTRAMGFCVPIYIFLSGYGLSITYERSKNHELHTGRRLSLLYGNLWTICLLFIPIGWYLHPEVYPGDIWTLLGNLSGINTTYNLEWWFLFPYVLLMLCSRHFIRYIHQLSERKAYRLLLEACILSFAIQLLRKVVPDFIGRQMIIWYFTLLFPFLTGIVFAHFTVFSRCRNYFKMKIQSQRRNLYLCLLILAICLLRMTIGPSMYNPLFATVFLILFVSTERPDRMNQILEFFGKHSTNMWLTHTFLSWYFFSSSFYALRYPLLIYAALIVASLCISEIVSLIYTPIQLRIKNMNIIQR